MMSAGNECFGAHAPTQPTHLAKLDEGSLRRNLEAACHSIVHILGFFYALSLGQIAAQRSGKPLLFLRYAGFFPLRVDLV